MNEFNDCQKAIVGVQDVKKIKAVMVRKFRSQNFEFFHTKSIFQPLGMDVEGRLEQKWRWGALCIGQDFGLKQ